MDDTREVFHIALRKLGYSGNSTDDKQIDEAYAELQKLMPNVLVSTLITLQLLTFQVK